MTSHNDNVLNNLPGGDRQRRAVGRAGRRGRQQAEELPEASISEFDGVRYLHLGHTPWVQGAMRIHRPRKLELEYIQRMMAWLLLVEPQAAPTDWSGLRVAQLGLGAAALARFCHGELRTPTTVVELNPQVIAACRQWFRLPADDERLQVLAADAGAWVAEPAQRASADVLCVDLYDHEAAAPVLDDADFYRHCFEALDEGGVLSVNLFGRNASFARSARRIAQAFVGDSGEADAAPRGEVWMLDPTDEGNTIVLAIKGGRLPDAQTLARRAEQVHARTGLRAQRWLHLFKPVPLRAEPVPVRATPARRAAIAKTDEGARP
jgi:spermidine synthase